MGGQRLSGLAPALALLSCVLFCVNSELLQALQVHSAGSGTRPSPGVNLLLCHLGGLVFAPYFLLSTAFDAPSAPLGSTNGEFSLSFAFARRPRLSALFFAILLMGYNYCWLLSTRFLAASVTTALFQSSVGVVYALSVPMFGEPLTFLRVLGVSLLIIGAMLASNVTNMRDKGSDDALKLGAGVLLALMAAVGAALYQVLFRHIFGQWKHDPRFLAFFGSWVSLWHLLVILPCLLCAGLLGFEAVVFPSGYWMVLGTSVSAAIASAVNILYLCIALWGSVMLLPCASALSIPLTVGLDWGLHNVYPGVWELSGHLMVVAALVLIMDLASVCLDWCRGSREAKDCVEV